MERQESLEKINGITGYIQDLNVELAASMAVIEQLQQKLGESEKKDLELNQKLIQSNELVEKRNQEIEILQKEIEATKEREKRIKIRATELEKSLEGKKTADVVSELKKILVQTQDSEEKLEALVESQESELNLVKAELSRYTESKSSVKEVFEEIAKVDDQNIELWNSISKVPRDDKHQFKVNKLIDLVFEGGKGTASLKFNYSHHVIPFQSLKVHFEGVKNLFHQELLDMEYVEMKDKLFSHYSLLMPSEAQPILSQWLVALQKVKTYLQGIPLNSSLSYVIFSSTYLLEFEVQFIEHINLVATIKSLFSINSSSFLSSVTFEQKVNTLALDLRVTVEDIR